MGKIDNLSEEKKSIVLLETNIDDTSGEIIGHVQKLILKNSSHNMLCEKKYLDEYNLIQLTINEFIGRF